MERLVLNTRPEGKAKALSDKLKDRGFGVIEAPMMAIDFGQAQAQLAELQISFQPTDWVVFTSGNGAESLGGIADYREQLGIPRTAAVGKKTAKIAKGLGFRLEFVSQIANSDAFVDEFMTLLEGERAREKGTRIFLFRANTASPAFPALLSSAGFSVSSHTAYHSVAPKMSKEEVLDLGDSLGLVIPEAQDDTIDAIVLTSSRAVQNLLSVVDSAADLWRDDWLIQMQSIPVCVIGPKTEQTALEYGFRRVVEARDTDNSSLVEAVAQILG